MTDSVFDLNLLTGFLTDLNSQNAGNKRRDDRKLPTIYLGKASRISRTSRLQTFSPFSDD